MTERVAKPVIKNKFWVVEDHGQKIATIQARVDGGFVYVHDEKREFFPSVTVLKQKYKIKFGTADRQKKENTKKKSLFEFSKRKDYTHKKPSKKDFKIIEYVSLFSFIVLYKQIVEKAQLA